MSTYRNTLVTIRWDDNPPAIPALVDPDSHWNGWLNPYFTRDTFHTHADAFRALFPAVDVDGEAGYDFHIDADGTPHLIEHHEDGTTTEHLDRTVTIDGAEFYSLGWGFTWEEYGPSED